MHRFRSVRALLVPVAAVLAALMTVGCPPVGGDPQAEYDEGFLDGFDQDDYYWEGYFDSWDTLDNDPVYYDGDTIPYVEDPPYDAGYNDGLWYAYHDGYFVAYQYAFIIGFSEGYDNAYWDDFLDFLDDDQHIEYRNGGFGDGYHDGFSEGRVFGAADFEANIEFDWLGALLDYEAGVDLYFDEVDVGTGELGPVTLYEHGQNPFDLTKAVRKARTGGRATPPAIRKQIDPNDLELYRTIIAEAQEELDIMPALSLRSDRELMVPGTWLDRVLDYLDAAAKSAADHPSRATGPRAKVAAPNP